ncbi:MAG: exonuclease domain-containing protein [Clostridia bacterium]|nr:exonuclease domain-containing protein [Clostridia bacterium]
MDFTDYIVLDLEWNQASSSDYTKTRNGITLHGEIIQVGAVKLDEKFNIVDKYSADIKPCVYKKIAKRIEQITKISNETASKGKSFTEVVCEFSKWCGNKYAFLTWGRDDIRVLEDNLTFFNIDANWLPDSNYDLQMIFDFLTQKKGRQFSLDFAVEYYGITEKVQRHNALNDAYYTALVCEKMSPKKCLNDYRRVIVSKFKSMECPKSDKDTVKHIEVVESSVISKVLKTMYGKKVHCPTCGKKAALVQKYQKSQNSHTLIYSCKKHGYFVSALRLKVFDEYSITRVIRTIYCTDNAVTSSTENSKNNNVEVS